MCPVLHQLHEITVCHKRWGSNWVLWGITWKPNALEKSFLLAALRPVLQDRIKWNGNESLISTHTYTLTTNTNAVYQINMYTWEKFHKQHDHFCKATHEVNRSPRVFLRDSTNVSHLSGNYFTHMHTQTRARMQRRKWLKHNHPNR